MHIQSSHIRYSCHFSIKKKNHNNIETRITKFKFKFRKQTIHWKLLKKKNYKNITHQKLKEKRHQNSSVSPPPSNPSMSALFFRSAEGGSMMKLAAHPTPESRRDASGALHLCSSEGSLG